MIAAEIWPDSEVVDVRQLTGGVSAQTTALDVRHTNGRVERFVVREHGERDLARDPEIAVHEFQLLEALYRSGLPVPKPVGVVKLDKGAARQAVVMEFVDGDIITASDMAGWEVPQFGYWLARIHEFDLTSADLSFLVGSHRQNGAVKAFGPEEPPLMRRIIRTLGRTGLPESMNTPVLLHGDFWRGNLLWRGRELAAIIDWEDASIGDPVIDIAGTRLEIAWTLGIEACERFVAEYLSHRHVDLTYLPYWELVAVAGAARGLPEWGLPPEQTRQMMRILDPFAERALARLKRR